MKILCAILVGAGLAAAAELELKNSAIAVRVDPEAHGAITAIVDRASGRNFVARGGARPTPLYTITLADDKHQKTTVDSTQARSVTARTIGPEGRGGQPPAVIGQGFELRFIHENPALTVRVTVRVPAMGPLSYWWLNAENKSPLAVIRAVFPGFAVPQVLGGDPDDTVVIFPNANNSQRYWNLPQEFKYAFQQRRKTEAPVAWPFRLCSALAPDVVQMMALYDRAAGLYLASYDDKVNVKEYSVEGLDATAMRLNMAHLQPWLFGEDFAIPYYTAIGVFHGDWTEAAEIYRAWATRQPWCARGTLAAAKDTPEWIKRYPVHLRFMLKHPVRNDPGRTEWDKLLDKLEEFGRDYPELKPDAMVNIVDYDPGGFWAGFYGERWPAWMGDQAFAARLREIKRRGMHPSLEPFGWHLTLQDEYRPDYDLRKKPFFPDLLANTLMWDEEDARRPAGPAGARGSVCVKSAYGQAVFAEDARRSAPWGVDLLQLMEINLARRNDCFNPRHGHPPGAGSWIFEAAYQAARKAREAGRAANPDFGADKEETAESLIPVLDCMYIRNAQLKNMRWNGRPQLYKNNVPLFDYIYHEYIALIDGVQANAPETTRWCAGIAAALGHLTGPLFSGDPASKHYREAKAGGAFEIIRNAKNAYLSYARQHVVLGRVLPPPGVEFPEMQQPAQSVFLWQQPGGGKEAIRTAFVTPKVVQAAHLSPQGGVGLSFINVSDEQVSFELNPAKYAKYLTSPRVTLTARHNGDVLLQTQVKPAAATVPLTVKPRALLFVTLD